MLKDFDEFFLFCFGHGGTLRNHKQFGEMAQKLRAQIEACETEEEPDEKLSDIFKKIKGQLDLEERHDRSK